MPAPRDSRQGGPTVNRERTSRRTRDSRWRGFAKRYGWRAYALPVLVVITVAALLSSTAVRRQLAGDTRPRQTAAVVPPTASSSMTLKNDAPAGNVNDNVLKVGALPPGPPYPMHGDGTYRVLPGSTATVGSGQLYRYSVEAENGVTGVDLRQFADLVVSTLSDKRSWAGHGVALRRVSSGPVDFHVTLTSTLTTRKLCGYTVHVETSCFASAGGTSDVNRVVLNVARWVRGSAAYVGDLAAYRVYMINHEDGHALGHRHAHQCLPGGLAPVMMQQTFGLRSAQTGRLCQANPWPYPPGAKGAPGAEQPDTPQNDEYGLSD
ncbi:MAG TPA: DUF3152 domain-containing protein [Jatrophihabitans sp.]|nr:DUF3152 domain-containing protein [Jatrophihabitans sp.]